uniref:cysteine dioxygenase n=2 Tax=Cacopsylla melanoneura TaxID=428564 RepID=A0A8D8QIK7_9HEMI
MSQDSHLLEREKPIRSSPVSCSLTSKRSVSEDDLVQRESTSSVNGPTRSEAVAIQPETLARAKTCEYLRQRSYSEESGGYAPILPASKPVHSGKHAIEIKHCCLSPCDKPALLDERMKRMTIKVRSENKTYIVENSLETGETHTREQKDIFEELGECDMTGYGRKKPGMDSFRDTPEETETEFEDSLEESPHHLNNQIEFEQSESCTNGNALDSDFCQSNLNCTDIGDAGLKTHCGKMYEISNNSMNMDVKTPSTEISRDNNCADTEEKWLKSQCEKRCEDTNNNGITLDETSYFKQTQSINKVNPISNLNDLIEELHRVFNEDHVNVDYVEMVMMAYKSNPQEWKKYAKFDKFKYTRNLVDAGNDKFNLMILCWGEGHGSSVHDHADAHCFMKMLDGALQETRFAWPEEGNAEEREEDEEKPLQVIGRSTLKLNGVCYINDSLGLHRVENSSYSDRAVSLHLYSPPFNACTVFNERTGRTMISKVTFWSKFGKKDKILSEDKTQEIEDN